MAPAPPASARGCRDSVSQQRYKALKPGGLLHRLDDVLAAVGVPTLPSAIGGNRRPRKPTSPRRWRAESRKNIAMLCRGEHFGGANTGQDGRAHGGMNHPDDAAA